MSIHPMGKDGHVHGFSRDWGSTSALGVVDARPCVRRIESIDLGSFCVRRVAITSRVEYLFLTASAAVTSASPMVTFLPLVSQSALLPEHLRPLGLQIQTMDVPKDGAGTSGRNAKVGEFERKQQAEWTALEGGKI